MQYNPNVPHQLASTGMDRAIRLWDTRKSHAPLLDMPMLHAHWISCLDYNPYYDQLLLSCGSDGRINLSSVYSLSSTFVAIKDSTDDLVPFVNGLVACFDELHDDSIHSVKWSTTSAWTFASLDYGGRVVISHVPHAEKYKILLYS
jgi:WD40 repeat protein